MSSTKFVFFGPIRKPRCGNKYCGTLYSGARYVALWASCLVKPKMYDNRSCYSTITGALMVNTALSVTLSDEPPSYQTAGISSLLNRRKKSRVFVAFPTSLYLLCLYPSFRASLSLSPAYTVQHYMFKCFFLGWVLIYKLL